MTLPHTYSIQPYTYCYLTLPHTYSSQPYTYCYLTLPHTYSTQPYTYCYLTNYKSDRLYLQHKRYFLTIIHSRRVCFLLILKCIFPNCIAHVVSVPRSRDLQNIFFFTLFHILTVNILWTYCEDYIIAVFIGTLHHKPPVNCTVWCLEAFQYIHIERIFSNNLLSTIQANNFNNVEQ